MSALKTGPDCGPGKTDAGSRVKHNRPPEDEGAVAPTEITRETEGEPTDSKPDCLSLPLSALRPETTTGFNVFLSPVPEDQHAPILEPDTLITEKHRQELEDREISEVFVAKSDRPACVRYLEAGLPGIVADVTVEGAKRRYEAGEESVLVLIEAQDALVKRRGSYVNALRGYAVAVAELEGAIGGGSLEGLAPPTSVPVSPTIAQEV